MAWIEFHGAQIKRKKKFHDLRKELRMSSLEALGFLGSFWSEVVELADHGEITGWTPEYLCEVTGSALPPEKVWGALVSYKWLDVDSSNRVIVHDWLDYAGTYLRKKYGSKNRQRLVEIWNLHGKKYGVEEVEKIRSESGRNPVAPTDLPTNQPKHLAQGAKGTSASNIMEPVENSDQRNPECLTPEYIEQAKKAFGNVLSVKKHLLGMGFTEHEVDEKMGKKH